MDERSGEDGRSRDPQYEFTSALADIARPLNRIGLACLGLVLAAGLSLALAMTDSGRTELAIAAFVWLVL